MSGGQYSTMLKWDSRQGVAKLHGRLVALRDPPNLGSGPVHRVAYIPEIHLQEIQPRPCDPRRDWMTDEEIAAADRLLADLAGGE